MMSHGEMSGAACDPRDLRRANELRAVDSATSETMRHLGEINSQTAKLIDALHMRLQPILSGESPQKGDDRPDTPERAPDCDLAGELFGLRGGARANVRALESLLSRIRL
jgi:hypothetical protein